MFDNKTDNSKRLTSFINELKERKVLRVAVAYIVVTWVVIQVGESTFEALQLPDWSNTLLVVLIMFGFPFALLMAWAFELTPDGIVKDPDGTIGRRMARYAVAQQNITPGTPSIAVLQFEDMSSEQDQAYFCEGIAEEILCALDQVDGLKVASRLGSFQFDSRSADIVEIGRVLNVSTVLEGSVRKVNDRVRITIQLIDTTDGYQFWAGQYNHDMKDIFEVQEQMAQAVVNAMRLTLKAGKLTRLVTKDSKAYDLFLKANSYFNRPDKQSILFARQFYQQAVEIDPGFGRAWAKLASTYVFEFLCSNSSENVKEEARRISDIALSVAPEIADSHIASGITHTINRDYKRADLEFETAVHLHPDSFAAWFTWGRSKSYEGDARKAVEFYQKASQIRPRDYHSVLVQVRLLIETGDLESAKEKASEGLQRAEAFLKLNPDEYRAKNMGAFALHILGQVDRAKAWMEESMQSSPRNSVLSYNAASFYAMTGDINKSLEYLTRAAEAGCLNFGWLEKDPCMKRLESEPQFKALVSRFKGGCACGTANPLCL